MSMKNEDPKYQKMLEEDKAWCKKYRRKYRVWCDKGFDENGRKVKVPGSSYIPSRLKPHHETGTIFEIHDYDGKRMAAVMPLKLSRLLLKRFPFTEKYLEADDSYVLLFPADRIDEVAPAMQLRTRRQVKLSPERQRKLIEAGTAALLRLKNQLTTAGNRSDFERNGGKQG